VPRKDERFIARQTLKDVTVQRSLCNHDGRLGRAVIHGYEIDDIAASA